MNNYIHVNFNGFPSPSYFCGGLSHGNRASMANKFQKISPKQAAEQVLNKINIERQLGITQVLIPPHPRPSYLLMNDFPLKGGNIENNQTVYGLQCFSSAHMWAANSATFHDSAITGDNMVHITPANCSLTLHRQYEHKWTKDYLDYILNSDCFKVHNPTQYPDEGAANTIRLWTRNQQLVLFVYGKATRHKQDRFKARQSKSSIQTIIKRHRLSADQYRIIEQNKQAIQAGVFHNDVIAMGHADRLILHEHAFEDQSDVLQSLNILRKDPFKVYQISSRECPVSTAIETYFFNSQLFQTHDGLFHLMAPIECKYNPSIQDIINRLIQEAVIDSVNYIEYNASMMNGGGPACSRLKTLLTMDQLTGIRPSVFVTDKLANFLSEWIQKFYSKDSFFDTQISINYLKHLEECYRQLYSILELPQQLTNINKNY